MTTPNYLIEKFVHGGFGLSRDKAGRIVLIEGSIPGETVKTHIWSQAKKVSKGVATDILNPAPQRTQPPCPHYRLCGGCDFQHMAYPFQLQAKKEIIQDLLRRSGHPLLRESADTLLADPLAAPSPFHYRQRIRLQVDDGQVVGFHKRHSHNCVAIESCLLAREEINDCLRQLLSRQEFHKLLPQTLACEILLDAQSSQTTILLHFKRKPRPADKIWGQELTDSLSNLKDLFFVGSDFAATGCASLSFTLPPMPPATDRPFTLSWESGGFCQVNLEQNQTLIKTVLDFCQLKEDEEVLDLFCGMGNFTIPLAEQAKNVLGIEGQGSAIRSARKNSSAAAQNNATFHKSPIHQACEKLCTENKTFDCVVIDPPRQGAPGLAPKLAFLCNTRLVYISCDPATLCRDLTDLLSHGFALTRLQPVDMFPQTHHIETVALLEKMLTG